MRDRVLNVLRLGFGLLAAVALGVQAHRTVLLDLSMANFFSYFTNLSNMAAVVVLLVGGTLGLLGRGRVPDLVRGGVVLYMTITGLVYAVALSGYDLGPLLPWVNTVVHRLLPLVLLADWLADPPRRPISRQRALSWLLFPLLYLSYTLIRGAVVDWYPYPFLDPRHPDGYGRVGVACLLVTLAFAGVGAALVWAGNRLGASRGTAGS
ncbi:Pr6Pr family membrane protein [Kitasatospora sp. NPDC002040]|uniref:Pr6Pr family membrane protein n=1 Tax=Kitasatospora sp. NPDC002040 TaxID=3154661 RepID=UPI00331C7D1E